LESKAEQYYPTYTFKPENRDVVLLEFEEAQRIANGQTKLYGQVANILLAIVTIIIPFFFNQIKDSNHIFSLISDNALIFSVIIFLFGALMLRYFVDLQKQITINARKVVTLRTMLGLDYGHLHLTLPNWRVEGATNPFAIKYFNGWLRFQSMPFWVLTIGINTIWLLTTYSKSYTITFDESFKLSLPWYLGNILITAVYLFIFRRNLNDTHETSLLNFWRFIVKALHSVKLSKFRLVDNFEYTVYRAKLNVFEMARLNVNYENMKNILVDIEDQSFFTNKKGFSINSLLRALLSHVKPIRKRMKLIPSGGSTITMQLARTLFIPTQKYLFRRKFFEILLSQWLTRKFTKQEIINLYIVSVRYEIGVLGLANAIKYFFKDLENKILSNEECFVLVERLSNNTSTYRKERINYLMSRTSAKLNKDVIVSIYKRLIKEGKIKIEQL